MMLLFFIVAGGFWSLEKKIVSTIIIRAKLGPKQVRGSDRSEPKSRDLASVGIEAERESTLRYV